MLKGKRVEVERCQNKSSPSAACATDAWFSSWRRPEPSVMPMARGVPTSTSTSKCASSHRRGHLGPIHRPRALASCAATTLWTPDYADARATPPVLTSPSSIRREVRSGSERTVRGAGPQLAAPVQRPFRAGAQTSCREIVLASSKSKGR